VHEERLAFEARAKKEGVELTTAVQEVSSRCDAMLAKLMTAIDQAKSSASEAQVSARKSLASIEAEVESRKRAEGSTAERLAGSVRTMEAKLAAHEADVKDHLAQLGDYTTMEARLCRLIEQEVSAREAAQQQLQRALGDLPERLQREAAERLAGQEQTMAAAATAVEAVRGEARARESALAKLDDLFRGVSERLGAEERARASDAATLEAACADARRALEREAQHWAAGCRELRAEGAAQQQGLLGEVQRWRTAQAEEGAELARRLEGCEAQMAGRLSAELAELQQQCEGLTRDTAGRVHAELSEEVRAVNTRVADFAKAQSVAMDEHRAHCDKQARAAAADVRAALEANSEAAEALEGGQRLLLEHIKKELAEESQRHEGCVRRVSTLELDLQRIKGHLPILFASPGAFG